MWAKVVVVSGVARPGSETCETNPIRGSAELLVTSIVQNEPNLARAEGKCAKRTQSRPLAEDVGWGRPTPDGVGGRLYGAPKSAKRTQSAPRAQEWARAGGPCGAAGERLCKTNPISKCQLSSLKFQGSGRGRLHTSGRGRGERTCRGAQGRVCCWARFVTKIDVNDYDGKVE
jgi:hypothetical protein